MQLGSVDKSKICGISPQTRDSGKAVVCFRRLPAASVPSSLPNLRRLLFRPLVDSMRPTHIVEGNRLYSESTHLNVNLI